VFFWNLTPTGFIPIIYLSQSHLLKQQKFMSEEKWPKDKLRGLPAVSDHNFCSNNNIVIHNSIIRASSEGGQYNTRQYG
jgi:hypothetical protein